MQRWGRLSPLVYRNAHSIGAFTLPAFLVPSFSPYGLKRSATHPRYISQEVQTAHSSASPIPGQAYKIQITFPITCPGCGALGQITEPDEAGYYKPNARERRESRSVKGDLLGIDSSKLEQIEKSLDKETRALLDLGSLTTKPAKEKENGNDPLCSRCHQLLHHNFAVSAAYPTLDSISATIADSPHSRNHVYHVIDAADFPLSVIPSLPSQLSLRQRSQNRRARHRIHSNENDVTFVITRADLLARTKPDLDRLLPRITEILRKALGRSGRNLRLGNVKLVSSSRNWWTGSLKKAISERSGAGWFVGKVNVGKSRLFSEVFPKGLTTPSSSKGRIDTQVFRDPSSQLPSSLLEAQKRRTERLNRSLTPSFNNVGNSELEVKDETFHFDGESVLLPPRQKKQNYPAMPIVSSLRGTTVSPIRVPFGVGGGELIDLPGLFRGDLERFVEDKDQSKLLMRKAVESEQLVIKPGQSLLLGGLFRITPRDPDSTLILLAYSFLNFDAHITSTEKAIAIQEGTREPGFVSIAKKGIEESIKSAGVFRLSDDITKVAAGPLTARDAGKMKAENLPFKVLATDILFEGCGFVELRVQVRKRRFEKTAVSTDEASNLYRPVNLQDDVPSVEVFSPQGKFVGQRATLSIGALLRPKEKKPIRPSRRPIQISRKKALAKKS